MNRRGFFKALAAIAAAPVTWKLGQGNEVKGDMPTVVRTDWQTGQYAIGLTSTTTTYTTGCRVIYLRDVTARGKDA